MITQKPRKPRKPRTGEYFVFHDDPQTVVQVGRSDSDLVYYRDCYHKTWHNRSPDSFREFYTRIPM